MPCTQWFLSRQLVCCWLHLGKQYGMASFVRSERLIEARQNSMIITRTKIVVPTQLEWLVLLVMIGVFSFLAQVTGLRLQSF